MDLTAETRATAATAAVAGVVGLAVTLHGAIRNQPAHSLSGICITMIALTGLILIAIRKWTTDTSAERAILAAAQREAQARRDTYFAAQAALENEQGRLNRDMAAERAGLTARLKTERDAMAAEFEERRASLIAETMEATVLMIRDGKLACEPSEPGNLIQFPAPQQERAAERARAREHGVVGP